MTRRRRADEHRDGPRPHPPPAPAERLLRRRRVRPDLRPPLGDRAEGPRGPLGREGHHLRDEQVSLMMAGAQMGITVCSLALGAISEPAIARLIAGPLELLGVPGALTHPIAFAIALSL